MEKYIKQKLVIEIKSRPNGRVDIKHTFTPPINMKDESKNNKYILECFLRFMELLKKKEMKNELN